MSGISEPLLSVEKLSIAYRSGMKLETVVEDVSFTLQAGEVLGLAGESGCGKSTLARAAMGWLSRNAVATAGDVRFRGESLLRMKSPRLQEIWGRQIAYIPQEVSSGLNPSRRIYAQLMEVLELHSERPKQERLTLIEQTLAAVGLDSDAGLLSRYPFECSGGQQQRIIIAMAILCSPQILILDEPTTGIDATLRKELLELLRQLLASRRIAAIYISHDLAEVAEIATRLAILYAGQIVEKGAAQAVFERPQHPYSRALLAAVPRINSSYLVEGIPGTPPHSSVRGCCSYAERCTFVRDACVAASVPLIEHSGRAVRCIRAAELSSSQRSSRLPALPSVAGEDNAVLQVRDIRCSYGDRRPTILNAVSFDVRPGELVGLVGESGSGKSTLLRAVSGLHVPSSGTVVYRGEQLAPHWSERSLAQRREIQLIFQNPERSLNPRRTVEQILTYTISLYEPALDHSDRLERTKVMLRKVRLPLALMPRYPHQLSGGEKQRVAIARAFVASPTILLCDEIVSALDVSVQAVVMRLIRDYAEETGASAIFVSHDLAVVRMMSAKVLVLHRGTFCEQGPTARVFEVPEHAYTRQLLASLPGIRANARPS